MFRRRQRSGTREGEASRAGLRPDGVYVYVEWGEGRTNRPPCTVSPDDRREESAKRSRGASTVAAKQEGAQGFYKIWVSDAPIEAE